MLISTSTTLAVRCPQCGQLELTPISRFALGRGESVKVTCSCGHHQLTIGMRQKQIWVQVPCYLCDGMHFLYFTPEQFWSAELKQLACAETELQLGVFGGEQAVVNYARPGCSELERFLDDAAFDDFFDEPGIMYQVLSQVHDLSEDGNVACTCGNREISVDIFPDRLELYCADCGRQQSVPATSEQDLDHLLCATHLEIGGDRPPRRKHKK